MNNEVLVCTKMVSLETIMTHHQLWWVGHLAWMPDIHLPRQILFSEHVSGKRPHRVTCRRFKDQLKNTDWRRAVHKKKKISICWKRRKTNRRDKESPKKSQCSPSLEPSYTTQKDMSVSSPILGNDNSVGWLLLVRKVKYSISHNCCSEKHESISSPSAHELNSRVDWALQPWMGSNIEDLLWIQNHRKDNRKALHYLQDVMV